MSKEHNMKHLGGSKYVVRTQAGFKQAIKHYDPNKDLHVSEQYGFRYPISYPSVVEFGWNYYGAEYLWSICTPIAEYRQRLSNLLEILEHE